MSKLKDLIPNMFSSNKNKKNKTNNVANRLEKDACVVGDDGREDENLNALSSSTSASTELTESVVRELSHPNYDSATGAVMERSNDTMSGIRSGATNTMNVQNNQQQNINVEFSNSSNIHIGSVFNFNNNLKTTATKGGTSDDLKGGSKGLEGKRRTPKTLTIVAMMQSEEEPNHRMLDTIATHLGEGWKQVMRDLGHSEGQIDQGIIDHQVHGGIKEVIYRLLLQWIRSADDNEATLGHITKLLWNTDHRDCVEQMKVVWKAEEKQKTSK